MPTNGWYEALVDVRSVYKFVGLKANLAKFSIQPPTHVETFQFQLSKSEKWKT